MLPCLAMQIASLISNYNYEGQVHVYNKRVLWANVFIEHNCPQKEAAVCLADGTNCGNF